MIRKTDKVSIEASFEVGAPIFWAGVVLAFYSWFGPDTWLTVAEFMAGVAMLVWAWPDSEDNHADTT